MAAGSTSHPVPRGSDLAPAVAGDAVADAVDAAELFGRVRMCPGARAHGGALKALVERGQLAETRAS